jgi:hypothetical protein
VERPVLLNNISQAFTTNSPEMTVNIEGSEQEPVTLREGDVTTTDVCFYRVRVFLDKPRLRTPDLPSSRVLEWLKACRSEEQDPQDQSTSMVSSSSTLDSDLRANTLTANKRRIREGSVSSIDTQRTKQICKRMRQASQSELGTLTPTERDETMFDDPLVKYVFVPCSFFS